jgi:hypothetical protein
LIRVKNAKTMHLCEKCPSLVKIFPLSIPISFLALNYYYISIEGLILIGWTSSEKAHD